MIEALNLLEERTRIIEARLEAIEAKMTKLKVGKPACSAPRQSPGFAQGKEALVQPGLLPVDVLHHWIAVGDSHFRSRAFSRTQPPSQGNPWDGKCD
jgi:hypothetical protein